MTNFITSWWISKVCLKIQHHYYYCLRPFVESVYSIIPQKPPETVWEVINFISFRASMTLRPHSLGMVPNTRILPQWKSVLIPARYGDSTWDCVVHSLYKEHSRSTSPVAITKDFAQEGANTLQQTSRGEPYIKYKYKTIEENWRDGNAKKFTNRNKIIITTIHPYACFSGPHAPIDVNLFKACYPW